MSILSILKVKFTADTTEFKKSAAEGQKAMDDFTGKSGDAFSSLADAVGVDLGAIGKSFGEFKSAIGGLGTAFSTASKASGGFSGAMNVLKLALISTGIGAFVVILGSLVAYFTSTEQGANKLSTILSGVGAVFKVLTDRAADLGKVIFGAFENPKQAISDLWEFIKGNIVNRFTGIIDLFKSVGSAMGSLFSGDWDGLKKNAADALQAVVQINTGFDKNQQNAIAGYFKGMASEMSNEAKEAANLKAQLNSLEIAEREMAVTSKQREAAIKSLKYIVEDVTKSDQARIKATEQAIALQKAMLNDERSIAAQRVKILQEQMNLGNNTSENYQALADAKVALADVDARIIDQMIEMNNKYNQLNADIIKRRQETDKYLQTALPDLTSKNRGKDGVDITAGIDAKKLAPIKEGYIAFAEEIKSVMIDLTSTIQQAMEEMAFSTAEALGQMMAGSGTMQDFGSIVVSSLAGTMVTIGKLIASAGLACFTIGEAFQKALTTPAAGLVAVAAGLALVAVGSALKSNISSAASGGSSGFSASASKTNIDTRNSSSSASTQQAALAIQVTGEFKQRGSDLVAVVNKENNRKTLTT